MHRDTAPCWSLGTGVGGTEDGEASPGVVALDGDDGGVAADDDGVAGGAGVVVEERAVDEGIRCDLGRKEVRSWPPHLPPSPSHVAILFQLGNAGEIQRKGEKAREKGWRRSPAPFSAS